MNECDWSFNEAMDKDDKESIVKYYDILKQKFLDLHVNVYGNKNVRIDEYDKVFYAAVDKNKNETVTTCYKTLRQMFRGLHYNTHRNKGENRS